MPPHCMVLSKLTLTPTATSWHYQSEHLSVRRILLEDSWSHLVISWFIFLDELEMYCV